MISRFLQRSDDRFIHSALSAQQRTAALATLRGQRASLGYVAMFVFACFILGGVLQFFSHRPFSEPSPFLLVILLMLLLFQQDLTSQIRILEVLQRGQFKAATETMPTA